MTIFGNHRGRGRPEHHGRHQQDSWLGTGRDRIPGRGRERMFEHGDLKLVVLNLLRERPRHGYEIIKAVEELAGGEYSPSPGVIYPTLTLLEELGQATVNLEQGGKKQYGITAEGAAILESQREILERILGRLSSAGAVADARCVRLNCSAPCKTSRPRSIFDWVASWIRRRCARLPTPSTAQLSTLSEVKHLAHMNDRV